MTTASTPRLLLVEDNPGDARYIRELLEEADSFAERSFERRATTDGGAVAHAGSPVERAGDSDATLTHETRLEDALDRLDADAPDVVLLDLDLPDSTGLDTLRAVVERDELVPVVVLTGLRDREVGIEALRQGAEEYLVKDEINADLLVRSVYHAVERKAREREQRRYRTLIKESTDASAIIDPDGTIEYLTPSVEGVLGYAPEDLVGEDALAYVHPDDRAAVSDAFRALAADDDGDAALEFRFRHADGSWIYLRSRARNLLGEPAIDGLVVYTHDVTERRERTRRLERQRRRLAALNHLNEVVHGVTAAVIERSTRTEVEQTACDRLAAADSYGFAWVCEPDPHGDGAIVRATADETVALSDAALADGDTAIGRALRTGDVQTMHGATAEPRRAPDGDEFRSAAAIPLVHEDTVYAVLSVHTSRADAFEREERDVVAHLGETVGHAIAAADRKRALLSDSVIELDLAVPGAVPGGVDAVADTVTIHRTVPVSDDDYLVYGEATVTSGESLDALTEAVPAWETIEAVGEREGDVRFELRASAAPIASTVASLGGSVERALIDGRDVTLTARLPADADVRQFVETVREDYPDADVRRQVTQGDDSSERLARVWSEGLTDRQRSVVEAAYFAGFFEWPRATSGEEVAASLDISGPTFSEHLRAAERKLLAGILDD